MIRSSVRWFGDHVEIVEQTALPENDVTAELRSVDDVIAAIRRLSVRGAPAIGICGAYGLVMGLQQQGCVSAEDVRATAHSLVERIRAARPTAVNLEWALRRVVRAAARGNEPGDILALAESEAQAIQSENEAACRRIGELGRSELSTSSRLLTHCNTGWLAACDWGTALGIVYAKAEAGESVEVIVAESRPLLQGARLTTWELLDASVPVTLVTDSAAAAAIGAGKVDAVLVGCDRVARNGDVANKVGTYSHALAAVANGIPFYVAGPISSFDLTSVDGAQIEIELRGTAEVLNIGECQISPEVPVWNPAFDVTPGDLVTAFITEVGVLRPPYEASISDAVPNQHAGVTG